MDLSKDEQGKLVKCPSWCAEMGQIIDFEVLAENLGISYSEAMRLAIDEHIALQEHEKRMKEK